MTRAVHANLSSAPMKCDHPRGVGINHPGGNSQGVSIFTTYDVSSYSPCHFPFFISRMMCQLLFFPCFSSISITRGFFVGNPLNTLSVR